MAKHVISNFFGYKWGLSTSLFLQDIIPLFLDSLALEWVGAKPLGEVKVIYFAASSIYDELWKTT